MPPYFTRSFEDMNLLYIIESISITQRSCPQWKLSHVYPVSALNWSIAVV